MPKSACQPRNPSESLFRLGEQAANSLLGLVMDGSFLERILGMMLATCEALAALNSHLQQLSRWSYHLG